MNKIYDVLWLADKLKKAGLVTDTLRTAIQSAIDEARAEERERCAKVCEYNPTMIGILIADEIRKEPT